MSKASFMNGLRLIIALVIVAGVLSFGSRSVPFHGLGVILAAVGGMDVDEDHGHDYDTDEERCSVQVHGHNPVNHSHVTMSLAAVAAVLACTRNAAWYSGPPWAVCGEPLYLLDRPPRSGVSM